MRVRITVLLLAVIIFCAAVAAAAGEVSGSKKTTVMIYMCGSDLEAKNFQGTSAIRSITDASRDTEQVNVVALLGGCPVWGRGYDVSKVTLMYLGGRHAVEADHLEGRSMGEPETLTAFLNICGERYPAEHYILIMWNHGGGPNSGVCFDLLYDHDSLSVGELASALGDSAFAEKGLDIIAFNTCLTGSVEYAANLAPFARYMVATEDSMYGLDYAWLKTLDSDESALVTAQHIVDGTYAFNRKVIEEQHKPEMNSVAAVDLAKMAPVVQAIDGFFVNVTPNVNINGFVHTSQCRRDSLTFGSTESNGDRNYDLADLGDLTVHLSEYDQEGADRLLKTLNDAVIYLRSDEENSTGLTIYHPYSNKMKLKSNMAAHNDIPLSEAYSAYIQQFAAMLTDTPLADWTDLHTERAEKKDKRTLFSLQLSEDQGRNLASSRFRVLHIQEDGSWTQIFDSPETYIFERNITGQYNGIALYAAADDKAVSPAITYEAGAGDTILIRAAFARRGVEGLPDFESDGLLCCTVEGDQLVPGGVMIYDEAMNSYTSIYGMTFQDFTEITIPCVSRRETRDDKGTLLPFEKWETVSEKDWSSSIDGSWSFRFMHDTISTEELYAAFEVADVQQYRYTSDLARVTPDRNVNIFDEETAVIQVQYDDMGLAVINQFNLVSGEEGLTMTIHVTNLLPDQEALIQLQELTVNGSAVNMSVTAYGMGEYWGLLPQETSFMTVLIPAADIPPAEEITDMTFSLNLLDAREESLTLGSVPVTVSIIPGSK